MNPRRAKSILPLIAIIAASFVLLILVALVIEDDLRSVPRRGQPPMPGQEGFLKRGIKLLSWGDADAPALAPAPAGGIPPAAEPDLAIALSGPNLILSWPANSSSNSLLQSTSLDSPAWSVAANVSSRTNQVWLPRPSQPTFYRLLSVNWQRSVTLAWNPSLDPSVTGYRVYYGVASRAYTNTVDVGSSTNVTLSNLVAAVTYYFAATAYNDLGLESDYSNEVSYSPPFNL